MEVEMKLWVSLLFALTLAACASSSVQEDLDVLAGRFVEVAAIGDSAAVTAFATGVQVWERISVIRGNEPELLNAAASGLEAYGRKTIRGDTAAMFFRFPYEDGEEEIGIRFLQRAGIWKVDGVSFPNRI
jgi:hypothetical protein